MAEDWIFHSHYFSQLRVELLQLQIRVLRKCEEQAMTEYPVVHLVRNIRGNDHGFILPRVKTVAFPPKNRDPYCKQPSSKPSAFAARLLLCYASFKLNQVFMLYYLKTHLLPGAGALLFAALVLIALQQARTEPSPAPAPPTPAPGPTITWSETHIELTLSLGENVSWDLFFTSSGELHNVVLEPVPTLAGFMSLTPNSFLHVPGTIPQPVHIDFAIPEDATFGTYEGTVLLKDGRRTLPQSLKVLLNVWRTFSDAVLPFEIKYPPTWTAQPDSVQERLRLQNYDSPEDEREGLSSDEIFIEVFSISLAANPDYQSRITNSEAIALNGTIGIRGFRNSNRVSPLPGYDMYVPSGGIIRVVAASYDGLNPDSLQLIKSIQETFQPF